MVCPTCGRDIARKLNGEARVHRVTPGEPAHCLGTARQLELELAVQLELVGQKH